MKIKIDIKSWLNGSVLFSYEKEENTIKETVLEAINQNANLRYADLRYDNLSSANLSSANLSSADLRYADLRYANFSSADLSSADLRYADLRYANFSSADLSSANLSSADLSSANLSYANLRCAKNISKILYKNPIMLLMAYHNISDEICLELMRYDCANLPNGKRLFDDWAKGGSCPYNSDEWQRVANFNQNKKLWKYGKSKTALQIWKMIEEFNK